MRDYSHILEGYVDSVLSGAVPAGVYTVKAVQRFVSERKRERRSEFPFAYRQEEADRLMAFAEALKPGDMDGRAIELLPWQVFCLSNLEGWRWKKDTGRKRFRTAYIEVNRKNGKTTGLLFPLVLYNFLKYKSSESYIVSSDDRLSEKTFKEVADIVKADDSLDGALKCQSLAITFKDTAEKSRLSFYCDGGKVPDGLRPRFFCLDEYHLFSTDKILDSMTLGMRSKKDAQGVMITTADTDVSVPCYEQHLKTKRILNGVQSQDDFFGVIYALDENDDYHNPDVWIKANPSLNDIIDPSVIKSDIDNAELTPHKIPELKAKTFGIWGGGSERSWIPVEIWQKNKDVRADISEFEGAECFGGLDLAQVDDLCALTLMFRRGGKYFFFHRFYIPEQTVYARYRKENVNFISWVEGGIITATPGATTDFGFIIKDILDAAGRFRLRGLGYDKWQSRTVIEGVEDARPDIALIEIEQSLRKLSPLTKDYEKAVKDGAVVDNSPVMTWMMNNVEINPDANGNYKPMKSGKNSGGHIDGVISSIMALGVSNSDAFQFGNIDVSKMFF